MAWAPLLVPVCVPDATASGIAAPCPEGHKLTTITIYTPNSDPSIPSMDDFQYAGYAFAIVITVYLFSLGVGAVLQLFRGD